MKKRQRHHLTGQAQVAGVLGACLFTILFPRLLWQRSPASSIPMAATPAPLPRGPSAVELRMARQYLTRAKMAVNREREAIEAWDPQILAGIDAEAWRLQLMAADPGGDLDCARAAARRAAVLARTPEEAGAAAEL